MLDLAPDLTQAAGWMPIVFLGVMGLAMLAYVILDGYDLGVGVLMRRVSEDDKDSMIASIGPFWDANETWLVLGVGILLTVFPMAHGVILGALYLPVAMMLIGLTLRGVAFDFRVKARAAHKPLWNRAFYAGSLMAGWSQGYMLGSLITGFASTGWVVAFNAVIGLALLSAYCLLGAGWLIIKSGGALQLQAVRWARGSLLFTMAGVAAISLATPLVSRTIFDKWFAFPNIVLLLPIPAATAVLFWVIHRSLQRLPTRLAQGNEYGIWVPFGATIGVFLLAFYGLAYSLFPWLVIDRINIWQAAIAPESMGVILAGAAVVLPMIVGYTVFAYRVFWGKSAALKY
ncbi:cytochrome d ubiquinol oxidase subunit II [Polaromonas sp.]|uniref:cytochrome d ubiquinol oxidase subunit II n=1 Tax=Polaromonas sp. TaxID=1869339 RepID=UPI0017FC368A|nr:cytochrome d ubiquinol oxidase subunit II [Polaromonas sp.]NML86907.1 cytochrome d ubiquinol oxidase subunit II [Polaromonas sp.]